MIANPEKYQVIFLGVLNPTTISLNVAGTEIFGKTEIELLGLNIDHNLNFSNHIKTICKNANNKTSALLHIRNYLNYKQALILVNSYIISIFYYCPLVWMFCQKKDYKLIQKTHKRALKVLSNNFVADYNSLLKTNIRDSSVARALDS